MIVNDLKLYGSQLYESIDFLKGIDFQEMQADILLNMTLEELADPIQTQDIVKKQIEIRVDELYQLIIGN